MTYVKKNGKIFSYCCDWNRNNQTKKFFSFCKTQPDVCFFCLDKFPRFAFETNDFEKEASSFLFIKIQDGIFACLFNENRI